ncbi:restriction endonuclease [Nocardia flavorosea]|uniref:Restriction endonuclease n=1 Tax=Nocardia flavorosea TaxID=53429 RepID=A0A846YKW5_9NOCA|nr:restriction endonuclease [Nocardia flavorosea]NKY59483.1 restriction endonuclease [Nocardia flavorosea]
MIGSETAVAFDALREADLHIDRLYLGGAKGTAGDDALARLLPVGNQGGFRLKGSVMKKDVRLVALFTTGAEPDWPDQLDLETGIFTYYGDNRKPGSGLHQTTRSGNLLLRDVFEATHGLPEERAVVPPFLCFEKAAPGRSVRFRGLLAPGTETMTSDEDLSAIWRHTKGARFQNYRAFFTVLDVGIVERTWLTSVLRGEPTTGPGCPAPWREWVDGRVYRPLVAPSTLTIRTKDDQLPDDPAGWEMLRMIRAHFEGRETDFEECAVAIWRMMAPATGKCTVTLPSRDGGRDAVGAYLLGPGADRVAVEFALEAKCYKETNSIGVKEMSRLISRIRHRQFGVFVTLSYFAKQVYEEVREDGHPIAMICGRDVVEALRQKGYSDRERLRKWLDEGFPRTLHIDSVVGLGHSVGVGYSILDGSRSVEPGSRV